MPERRRVVPENYFRKQSDTKCLHIRRSEMSGYQLQQDRDSCSGTTLNNATRRICEKYHQYLNRNDSWKDLSKISRSRNSSSDMQHADSAGYTAYILVC
jgi:hypothetical protein